MPDSFTATISSGCQSGSGFISVTHVAGYGSARTFGLLVESDNGFSTSVGFTLNTLPATIGSLPNDAFRVSVDSDGGGVYERSELLVIDCSGGGGGGTPTDPLMLDVDHTDETAPGAADGTVTLTPAGGTAPLMVELVDYTSSEAQAGQPTTFAGLPPRTYAARVTDDDGQKVEQQVTVVAYVAGCDDEYADNYDPTATNDLSCKYSPRWRSAWGPPRVSVRVAAPAGLTTGYVAAELRVGFRPGHPLADVRPLGSAIALRATVAPDGYASFVLAPYLRPRLGAPDGMGGYRLDLNSPTAYDADLYVGYELRGAEGQLLEHGYALNAAVPDEALGEGLLSPFPVLPVWPGFDDYAFSGLQTVGGGRYGTISRYQVADSQVVRLPCPPNPLPVAWLAPGGGFGFWVFQGKPALSDVVEDGQSYVEALTGESRYSERGQARRQYAASSGPFRGDALAEGLATLARAVQVWVRPAADGPWVPATIEAGTFPVRQWGVRRNEVSITFTEAAAWYAQGQ